MMSWSDRILLSIFKTFPARDLIFKDPGARPQSEYDAECAEPFYRWLDSDATMFTSKDLLDLGSGFGGRSLRFLEYGAKSVTGVEISEGMVAHANQFAKGGARFLVGTGEKIPSADAQFDMVTMFDVMEHVISPPAVLNECWRVLRPGGALAVVFPPYYDITGGSHLHGYATTFPALNLFFTTRALKSAAQKLLNSQGVAYEQHLREVPTDKLWNQNGLTVHGFRSLVKASPFRVERFDCLGHMERRLSPHTGIRLALRLPFYAIPSAIAKIPLVQEVFCSRVCALLRKPM